MDYLSFVCVVYRDFYNCKNFYLPFSCSNEHLFKRLIRIYVPILFETKKKEKNDFGLYIFVGNKKETP